MLTSANAARRERRRVVLGWERGRLRRKLELERDSPGDRSSRGPQAYPQRAAELANRHHFRLRRDRDRDGLLKQQGDPRRTPWTAAYHEELQQIADPGGARGIESSRCNRDTTRDRHIEALDALFECDRPVAGHHRALSDYPGQPGQHVAVIGPERRTEWLDPTEVQKARGHRRSPSAPKRRREFAHRRGCRPAGAPSGAPVPARTPRARPDPRLGEARPAPGGPAAPTCTTPGLPAVARPLLHGRRQPGSRLQRPQMRPRPQAHGCRPGSRARSRVRESRAPQSVSSCAGRSNRSCDWTTV